ncbi:NRDE family protein [Fibrella arboris]|uniref:NRDE family protein n=1 Tax=Fibrella arboris TaxID=3242486 RepID=UPI0035227692
MCTATYLPRPHGGFLFTHSRDEKTVRPAALLPRTYLRNGQEIVYPKDPQGGGTWIASSSYTTVCLLNGAFTAHQPQLPYGSGPGGEPQPRHSRGLVPLHVFDYDTPDNFLRQYDPSGLEPFTLLITQMAGSPAGRLTELRWNGKRLFINDKDPDRPHIWSSATLYTPDVIEQREGWFRDWLHHQLQPSVEATRAFHTYAGDDDAENAIRMNRPNGLMTLSLTSVVHQDEAVELLYDDFMSGQSHQLTLTRSDYATA